MLKGDSPMILLSAVGLGLNLNNLFRVTTKHLLNRSGLILCVICYQIIASQLYIKAAAKQKIVNFEYPFFLYNRNILLKNVVFKYLL